MMHPARRVFIRMKGLAYYREASRYLVKKNDKDAFTVLVNQFVETYMWDFSKKDVKIDLVWSQFEEETLYE